MSTTTYGRDVCSHNISFILDNFIRRFFQRPASIVGEYISPGDTVIDLGCGPGFFTIDMAELTGADGQVVAVDLQKEMLEKVMGKALRRGLDKRITPHQCPQDSIGLTDNIQADFILAFYMVHETPDQEAFLNQVRPLLKPNGRLLIVEPKFHVTEKKFSILKNDARKAGYSILDTPSGKGGRSLLLSSPGK